MGANKTEKAVLRSSMAVTGVSESLHAYDESPNVKPPSTAHTKKVLIEMKALCWGI